MTPGQRKTMYLNCLRAAERILTFEHTPQWGAGAWQALNDARSVLAGTFSALVMVTPDVTPPAILRSEVEGVAVNLACMAADALHPERPTPDDAAFMGVVSVLRRALTEIAKETV